MRKFEEQYAELFGTFLHHFDTGKPLFCAHQKWAFTESSADKSPLEEWLEARGVPPEESAAVAVWLLWKRRRTNCGRKKHT